jgi:signal transduction histidine kinase
MPPMTPPPARSSVAGNADLARGGAPRGPGARSRPGGPEGDTASGPGFSLADFFADALDGAIALVHADGGELATLDDSKQVLVLRARRTRPKLDTGPGSFGGVSRTSQPLRQPLAPPGARAGIAPPGGSFGRMPLAAAMGGVADEVTALDAIEIQSTQLLPATLSTRTYRQGERLIGHCWQRGEPVLKRDDECRTLPGGSAPPDPEAAWHLAVPILRPGSLATPQPPTEVIGVISVYNRDPLWSFSQREVELLQIHADRVARGMSVAELARQNQSQAELLGLLAPEAGATASADEPTIYQRLRDLVRHTIDAPSFAVLLYDTRSDEAWFELAERDGQPVPVGRLPASSLPPWWAAARAGRVLCISAPEDRAQRPEYTHLGWGGTQPVQSLLAAPLIARGRLIGALVAASPRADVYAQEHERLFTSIARSASVVIENARLGGDMRRLLEKANNKEQRLAILNNVTLTLNTSLDVDTTVRTLADQAAVLTGAKMCVVFLLDESERYLVGRAANTRPEGIHTRLAEARMPADWRGLDQLIKGGGFALMDNLESEWGDDTETGRLLAEQRIQSSLILPLAYPDQRIGILAVYTPGQRHHFTTEEIGLLQSVASQGAVAISNAMLYQEQQRSLEQLRELDRLKDEFILTVSHEFRTPLTTIEGYVTLISRHGERLEPEKVEQFAGEIHQASNQLMTLIENLSNANKLSQGALNPHIVPVSIRALAEKAIAGQAPDAKARIQLDTPADLWALADTDHLLTIVSNLLGNALKYSPAPAPVRLLARRETRARLAEQGRPHALAADAPRDWIVVGVRDQGEGIAEEDQDKLFQKFVRLSRSLTTSVRGTGLGLWICQGYIKVMGGDIWVVSEFGNGALFEFSLPAAAPPAGGA